MPTFPTRSVTFSLRGPSGNWSGSRIKFKLRPLTHTADFEVPTHEVSVVVPGTGDGSVALFVNEGGLRESFWQVTFPDRSTATFTVPTGGTAIALAVLLEAGQVTSAPQGQTLVSFVLAQWKGEWAIGTQYARGDKVQHDGSSYIALVDTLGDQPDLSPADWDLIAAKGTDAVSVIATEDIGATTYTLTITDPDKVKRTTSGVPVELTVPLHGSVPIPVGSVVLIEQGGSGKVTVVGAMGVTVNAREGSRTVGVHASAGLLKQTEDRWWLTGELEVVP